MSREAEQRERHLSVEVGVSGQQEPVAARAEASSALQDEEHGEAARAGEAITAARLRDQWSGTLWTTSAPPPQLRPRRCGPGAPQRARRRACRRARRSAGAVRAGRRAARTVARRARPHILHPPRAKRRVG
jgi:hypothetical protein